MPHQSLLLSFAHPDDESFGTGGTMAYYAKQGVYVALICATRGEVGEISDPALASVETLPTVREEELRRAAEVLGIAEVTFLDYRDSGMAGTPENDDPRAFKNASADEVVRRLVGHIRRLCPGVVVTFDPTGGYGHPDHIAIHTHTVAAFHAAADASQFPDEGEPWQAERLFFSAIPRSFFAHMRQQMEQVGVDMSEWEQFPELGVEDEEINAVLDVTEHWEAKWAALNAHRTQFGDNNMFKQLPPDIIKQMMSQEQFIQAWPQPAPGQQFTDLFADVMAD